MTKRLAIVIVSGLFVFTFSPLSDQARGPALAATATPSEHANAKVNRNCEEKKSSGSLPVDCGANVAVNTPDYHASGSSSFGILSFSCESPQPIYTIGLGKFCGAEGIPFGSCKNALGTFWYLEVGWAIRILEGSAGASSITWDSNVFPVSFTSSTLIVPGNVYGLCVLAEGGVMQDDFASGTAVAPSGDTANMTMFLASQYLTFDSGEYFDIFLEAAPARSSPSRLRGNR